MFLPDQEVLIHTPVLKGQLQGHHENNRPTPDRERARDQTFIISSVAMTIVYGSIQGAGTSKNAKSEYIIYFLQT